MQRPLALAMIALGALLIAGVVMFVKIALDFRHSFTSSDTPLIDMLQGLALLAPVVAAGAALIYFGVRRRKV